MKSKKYLLGVIVLIAFFCMGDISDTDTYHECNEVNVTTSHKIKVEVKSASVGAVTDAHVVLTVVHNEFVEGESDCYGHFRAKHEWDYSGWTDNDGFYYVSLPAINYYYDIDATIVTVDVTGGHEVGNAIKRESMEKKGGDKDFHIVVYFD